MPFGAACVRLVAAEVPLVPRGFAAALPPRVCFSASRRGRGRTLSPGTMAAAQAAFPGDGDAGSGTHDWVPLSRAEILAIIVFWTFIALFTVANVHLDRYAYQPHPAAHAPQVALAFVESYLWAALTPPIFWLSSRFALDVRPWLRRMLLLLGVGLLVALVVDHLTTFVRLHVLAHHPPHPVVEHGPRLGGIELWFLNDLIVYLAVLAAGFAREYFIRYRGRVEETVRLQAQADRLHAQLAEARLDALRTQLDPHFLFNTLNAVSALVERDPRGVRRMISLLGELLRHTLDGAREQEVPLAQEMRVVERYLEIMQIRFEGRLELAVHTSPAVAGALVPSLVLQPLVENALRHGIDRTTGTGRVQITAAEQDGRVVLRVRDHGPGLAPDAAEGVGVRNTRARLQQLYGDAQSFTLAPAEGGGTVAEVTLPYHTAADLRVSGVDDG
jgi:two-component system LytT family sensor kinase